VVGIVSRAKELTGRDVHLVLGGFHLRSASEEEITAIVDGFRLLGVRQVAPCHCSGDLARTVLGELYGEDFVLTGVGSIVPIGD